MKSWRALYRPEIAKIISENKGKTVKELKTILREANPGQWGWQKKVWANESWIQLGISKSKRAMGMKPKVGPGQLTIPNLFQ